MKDFHKTLIRFRVLYVIVTFFMLYLAHDGWNWFKDNHGNMNEAAAAGFIAIYLAVIGILKIIIDNSRQDDKHD